MKGIFAGRQSAWNYVVLGLLLAAAAMSWAFLVWSARAVPMDGTVTMGLSVAFFMLMWIVMMVAMMFPTAAPMTLTFYKIQSRRTSTTAFAATWAFLIGYLLLWSVSGILAYALARTAEATADHFSLPQDFSARFGGVLLIAAGVYQLTPLKNLCLAKCRTPINFIMTYWRSGTAGAFQMGWLHGTYCLGCCWFLFVILFPLGIMNIVAMIAVTLFVFVEKSLPWARYTAAGSAVLLIVYGAAVIAVPKILPTYPSEIPMDMKGMDMKGDMKGMDMPSQ
jgi:predicted metal-binding membrane protein